MNQKKVVILGSTGSIGVNALDVIEKNPERFKVVGLSAYSNSDLIEKQIQKFSPKCVAVSDKIKQDLKNSSLLSGVKPFDVFNDDDLCEMVSNKDVDIVLIAMRGSAALKPFLAAARSGKRIAPANKEALVIAGKILQQEAKKNKAEIIPIDSEQSAIFQCLQGENHGSIRRLILTASGGALLNTDENKFSSLTKKDILDHPRWDMGQKITVDSATLMNKGFEVIEAMRLFDLDVSKIDVVIHPQAIIHSMVEFEDTSVIAQMGLPDMRLPIQYALTYPDRVEMDLERMDFFKTRELTFQEPDYNRFPSLALAFDVAKKDGTLPSVLNAADEEVVEEFLKENLKFQDIYPIVEKVVLAHKNISDPTFDQILEADQWARNEVKQNLVSQKR